MSDRSTTMTIEQRVATALEGIEVVLNEVLALLPPPRNTLPRDHTPRPQPLASENVLVSGHLIDGSVAVALPNWQHLRFSDVVTQGSESIDGNGDLVVTNPTMAAIEWQITVQQANGKTVYFGYSWDGGPVQQLPSSVTVPNNNPTAISFRDALDMSAGTTLALYLSSNFDNQATVWSNSQVVFVQAEPEYPPTDAHHVYLSGQWHRRDGHGIQAPVKLGQTRGLSSPPIGTQLDPWVKRDVPAIDGEDDRAEPPITVHS